MKPLVHGKYTTYNKRGCRCDECAAAWRSYKSAYFASNPEQRAKRDERLRLWRHQQRVKRRVAS